MQQVVVTYPKSKPFYFVKASSVATMRFSVRMDDVSDEALFVTETVLGVWTTRMRNTANASQQSLSVCLETSVFPATTSVMEWITVATVRMRQIAVSLTVMI